MRHNLNFRRITFEDQAFMTGCRDWTRNPFTALTFPSLYTWRNAYGLTMARNDTAFIVRSEHDRAFFYPCGEPEACRALMAEAGEMEDELRFLYLTQEQAAQMAPEGWQVRLRPDLSEYLASTQALALRAGHASNSFKMKCRHYKAQTAYEIMPLCDADVLWLKAQTEHLRDEPCEMDMGDITVMEAAADGFHVLGLEGIRLLTGDGKEAFILGYESGPGMFTMTLAKHDPQLPPETTAVLVHELACHLWERYETINLEEDLGIIGLRQSKMLYSPIGRLDVYEAVRL